MATGRSTIAASEPTQASTFTLEQGQNSGTVTEDLQTGAIIHEFYLDGNPMEALQNPALDGIGGGQLTGMQPQPHPWFKNAYLIRRRFEHLIRRAGEQDQRRTKVTAIYARRPCPFAFEETVAGTSILMPMWWSLDDPPQPIGTALVPQLIYVQSRAMIRRWPNVHLTVEQLEAIHAERSKTNGERYAYKDADFWLLKSANTRLLYGDFDGTNLYEGNYELTLTFIGDPVRRHKHWSPKSEAGPAHHADNVLLQTPYNLADLPNVHHITTIHAQSDVDWNKLVPMAEGACDPTEEDDDR